MWKYYVIDCKLENLSKRIKEDLTETQKNKFKIKPMGFNTYEWKGSIRCVLAYARKKRN